MEKLNYYFWADGTWCDSSDLEDYLKFMSDDFAVLKVDSDDFDKYGFYEIENKQVFEAFIDA